MSMQIKTKLSIKIEDDYGGKVRISLSHAGTYLVVYCNEYDIQDKRKIIRLEDLVKEKDNG